MELIDWTAARCSAAARLSWTMVNEEGWLRFTQAKTGGLAVLPLTAELPAWAAALENDQRALLEILPREQLQWLVTAQGRPRSVKGLSQWLSRAATVAGLPDDCTAHELRTRPSPRCPTTPAGATCRSSSRERIGHAAWKTMSRDFQEARKSDVL